MKIENQVCALEQAKRLKELGVTQDSYFSWFGDERKRLMDNGRDGMAVSDCLFVANTSPINNQQADHRDDCCLKPIAAAFTVAELGELLPEFIPSDELGSLVIEQSISTNPKKWNVMYYGLTKRVVPPVQGFSMANAMCAMLIHLLENNLITPEDVDKRLNQ